MITLNLDEGELQVLKDLLEICLSDLRDEIRATDKMEYKQMLKQRREVLIRLREAIERAN